MRTNKSSASAYPSSTSEKTHRLRQAWRQGWTPPPRISVPDWADKYRKLAKEAGSTGGDWETSTVEIARGPMLAITEPGIHIISVMCCTQLMKTALLENAFGFFAHLDPCPMLLLQPKEEAAEQFSKERITPMVRATPVLRELVGTSKTRKSEETILYKSFPGGFLALAGAGSPDNVARRPIRVVLSDEIDKYVFTREGNTIDLAEERTATFGVNWLSIRACSPTIEGHSLIEASYAQSDQRRASLACPHCGHRQFPDFFKHVHWQKTESGKHLTKTARIYCERCSKPWSEGERLRTLSTARWHQTRPFECSGQRHVLLDAYALNWQQGANANDAVAAVWRWDVSPRHAVYRAICPTCKATGLDTNHAGFQAGKLYSPWQKDRPQDIAAKWLLAKGDADKEQAWWNTQAGVPYRATTGKAIQLEGLVARGEVWAGEVPAGVALLTVGIDTQDYRIELEVVGWGANDESWSIEYHIIDGEFEDPAVQAQLDAYLMRRWRRADGREFAVMAAGQDSGGHHTQAVYEFCKARIGRRIWALKGASERQGQRNPVWPTKRPTRKSKATYRPFVIGTNSAKDVIRHRLLLEEHGPGYMHFPADRDINYYAQLTAERIVVKTANGQKFRVWELPPGKANEALDCRVYAYAALCGLTHMGLKLNAMAKEISLVAVENENDEKPVTQFLQNNQTLTPQAGPQVLRQVVKVVGEAKKTSLGGRMAAFNK